MKKIVGPCWVLFLACCLVYGSAAEANEGSKRLPTHVFSAHGGIGLAMMNGSVLDLGPRWTGGGGLEYAGFINEYFGLGASVGFVGRGCAYAQQDVELRRQVTYLTMPIGVRLRFSGIQLGIALGFDFALAGRSYERFSRQGQLVSSTIKWGSEEWQFHRRFNFGPVLSIGYAIPVGPVAIVPRVTWSMHVRREAWEDAGGSDRRYMNVMFNIGMAYGITPNPSLDAHVEPLPLDDSPYEGRAVAD
jgi:hypothetical protein